MQVRRMPSDSDSLISLLKQFTIPSSNEFGNKTNRRQVSQYYSSLGLNTLIQIGLYAVSPFILLGYAIYDIFNPFTTIPEEI